MTELPPLPDDAARARIRTELGETLFVSAGAGSGKTTELVERVLALVEQGTEIERIAAITFTDKAADELRHRIRAELTRRTDGIVDPVARKPFTTALDELDQAAFCTLHSFAQRILTAFPLEAGLPPAITVLDEISSDADFDSRWNAFYDELLDRPELERTMTLALEVGIRPEHLRAVAEQLDDNWDRVRVRAGPALEPPPLDVTPILASGRELLAECERVGPRDALAAHVLGWLPAWLGALEASGDELVLLDVLLGSDVPRPGSRGTKAAWSPTSYGDPKAARDAVKGLIARDKPDGPLAAVLATLVAPILDRLSAELASFTLREARRRQRAGQLTFHDLLVLCRRLVEDPRYGVQVRGELAQRFSALLVDEYQDTDPLQLDIVVAIATPPDGDLPTVGQLFFVGDPKQSLYRFRRADINQFLRTPVSVGADEISLTTNFRSTGEILRWVNHVFERLIKRTTADDGVTLAQPAYEALDPSPRASSRELHGPPVTVVGSFAHPKGTRVGELREHEAAEVAAAIHAVRREGWTVQRRGEPDAPAVPARLRDIAILIPARTTLGHLETALREAGIPYQLDTGSLVYAADEIRALMLALRVIADPSDHLAVVSVLRSPLYGCSDVELYRWRRQRGGRWSPQAPRPERAGDDPVWDALADLGERIATRAWRTPSQHLESLVRERRVLETALASPSPADAWHRVRFVIEQARAWSDAGGRFLRDYLAWTRRQTGLTGRVAEVALDAAADDDRELDAVRVLTVHGAKGLEFPIAIVCGFNSAPGGRRRGVQVVWEKDGGQLLRMREHLSQPGFDERRAIDEQMDEHERVRLLYVACTRARDHLVVSLHRTTDDGETGAHLMARCVTAADDVAALQGVQVPLGPAEAESQAPLPAVDEAELGVLDLERWRADRAELVARARQPGAVSATALAARAVLHTDEGFGEDEDRFTDLGAPDEAVAGLAKRPVDLDLPAWRKGRYGTAVGRAVHAVLQVVDLRSGSGIDAMARAQAAAEGIEGEHERIARLARSALSAPCVQEAAAAEHWREVYVGAPVGGQVLEGYIDLLFRRPDGLVVIDHKTDQVTTDEDVAARLGAYRLQLAAYALALERATGEPVVDARLVFCGRDRAREEPVTDLRLAMAEAERLLTTAG